MLDYNVSPSPHSLSSGLRIWDLDLGPEFGTWIWDLDLGLDLGLTTSTISYINTVCLAHSDSASMSSVTPLIILTAVLTAVS